MARYRAVSARRKAGNPFAMARGVSPTGRPPLPLAGIARHRHVECAYPLGLVALVGRIVIAAERALQLANSGADGSPDLGELARAEQDDHHHGDHQEVNWIVEAAEQAGSS